DRHRLRVIARGKRHYPAGAIRFRNRVDEIRSAADFEGAAFLHVFAFEESSDPGFAVESVRIHHWSSPRDGADTLGGSPYVFNGYRDGSGGGYGRGHRNLQHNVAHWSRA